MSGFPTEEISMKSIDRRERNMDKAMVAEVLRVARRLDEKNLVNAYEGNISAKKDGLIYITPTGKNKAFLTEEMIAVIDGEGGQSALRHPSPQTIGRVCRFHEHSAGNFVRPGLMEAKLPAIGGAVKSAKPTCLRGGMPERFSRHP